MLTERKGAKGDETESDSETIHLPYRYLLHRRLIMDMKVTNVLHLLLCLLLDTHKLLKPVRESTVCHIRLAYAPWSVFLRLVLAQVTVSMKPASCRRL